MFCTWSSSRLSRLRSGLSLHKHTQMSSTPQIHPQGQIKAVRYLSARLRCGDAQQSQRHLTHDQITDQLPVLLHVLTNQRHRAVHHLTITHTHTLQVQLNKNEKCCLYFIIFQLMFIIYYKINKYIINLFQVMKMFTNVLYIIFSKYYFSQL